MELNSKRLYGIAFLVVFGIAVMNIWLYLRGSSLLTTTIVAVGINIGCLVFLTATHLRYHTPVALQKRRALGISKTMGPSLSIATVGFVTTNPDHDGYYDHENAVVYDDAPLAIQRKVKSDQHRAHPGFVTTTDPKVVYTKTMTYHLTCPICTGTLSNASTEKGTVEDRQSLWCGTCETHLSYVNDTQLFIRK